MSIKCPKCQFENLDESHFCSKCATPLISDEEISTSPTKTLETPVTGLTRSSTFAERYEVIEELDKGGMGKIYRVFDKKIEQEVALKLLRPEIAADSDTISRFKNELKFARNISHRNVCRMYDLDEEGNAYYITMEYISGENLKSSIRRMERLTIKKAISIAKQVCEGLEEAHRLGVVHRDLKPGNIMIDHEGNVRILDFGIARSLRSKGMTGQGVMIGTPEYMSPEQVDGEEADQRSDIYSLGVILYEMVTGTVPFKGDTPISVAVKHKLETPPHPNKINPQVPEDLDRLIMRCLDKDRQRRYESTTELLADLIKIEKGVPTTKRVLHKKKPKPEITAGIRWKKAVFRGVIIGSILILAYIILGIFLNYQIYHSVGPRKTIDAIAVLPMKNLSGSSEWDYFADRMTEYLIDEMTKSGMLERVPPSTSVMLYKTAPKRIKQIADELEVEAVIEWSMIFAEDKIQIKFKMIEPKREQIIYENTFERVIKDEFDRIMRDEISIQKQLTNDIMKVIADEIAEKEMAGWMIGRTRDSSVKPEALEFFEKGQFYWKLRPEGFYRANEYFRQAYWSDNRSVSALVGLAKCDLLTPYTRTYGHPIREYEEAEEYTKEALEINKSFGEAHAVLGWIQMCYYHDWKKAEEEFQIALERDANSVDARQWYANYLVYVGRFDEAVEEIRKTQDIDSLSPLINCEFGRILFYSGKYEQAINALQKTIERYPEFSQTHLYLGMAYLQKSRYEDALLEFQKPSQKESVDRQRIEQLGWQGIVYEKMGNRNEAQIRLDELVDRFKYQWSMPYSTAILYFALGERDEGFRWLEKAYENRDYRICLLKIDPVFDGVREDPRFQEMLKKVGLEQ